MTSFPFAAMAPLLLNKMSCLIVVFLVLAALTPHSSTSAYLKSTDAALDGGWYYVLASAILTPCRRSSSCPLDNNHDKAAAAERLTKAAAGMYVG